MEQAEILHFSTICQFAGIEDSAVPPSFFLLHFFIKIHAVVDEVIGVPAKLNTFIKLSA